ncbi:MAG: hypothetical protein ABIJ34_05655 [archaeon]
MDFDKLMQYQNMLQQNLRREQIVDKKIDILSIINQLTSGPRNIVQTEQVIVEATARGFSEEEVNDMIEKLIEENLIYESSPGYIKKR